MDRVAVLVDAGYLLARGAEAITGESSRRRVKLDETSGVRRLIAFAEDKTKRSESLLRVYWYDAARVQPSAEQIRLAELDNVKLRLGTFNRSGHQKGVDSLIIADMMELARNRGAADFVLVGADEDLRVGVQIAQSYGTRVHLLGITSEGECAQSPGLVREADTTSAWSIDDLHAFLSSRPPAPETTSGEASETMPGAVDAAVRAFYETLGENDVEDIKTVWEGSNSISALYDGRLLASTAASLGRPLEIRERREMRRLLIELLQTSNWTAGRRA